ncbi:hypothetical protein B0187_00745 [Haemophilus paracuniculus]|uniref:Uncharacterized protein n=1 Tax=Haemophilus paracuniculus TaxID=734 RepID=A0A1T0AVX2_9PAST|nr:hypothetical protein B0187_00745 [Haemophilus paracuniculus]
MPKVKISFNIEVDGNILIEHSIEYERLYRKPRMSIEENFAYEILNKMIEIQSNNQLSEKIDNTNWKCLFTSQCYV